MTEGTAYSRAVLDHLERADAVVPEVWPFEIANSIYVSFAKRKRINEAQIEEHLGALRLLPIRVEHQSIWEHVSLELLGRKHDLTAYDAAYLDLALRLDLPLATSDEALKRAALACGIKLLSP
jgi:predicted nucleic acid-binding protein